MNKYQEALEYMKANAVQEITNSYFRKHKALDGITFEEFDNNLTTLQELVDRETPKKPLPPKDTFFLHQCPNCKVDFIGSSIDRCQCGQKIGWNEE